VNAEDAVRYVGVVAGVALLVVVAAVVGASLVSPAPPAADADEDVSTAEPPPEYAPDAVVATPIESTGRVTVSDDLRAREVGAKTVVIDTDSRVEIEDVRPLVAALVRAGHDVRFSGESLDDALADADAYVRIDPGTDLDTEEIETLRAFTNNGGRMLLVGEPNRVRISQSLFSASVTTRRTDMTNLASEYGLVFGTRYLYDTTTNDGNFKNVLASPTDADDAPDLDRVAMYTAARVEVRGGQVLLRTPDTTELSNGGEAGRYGVAVRKGNVVALGDSTLLGDGRHNVADNEAFIGEVAGFLVGGERTGSISTDTPTPAGNETAT
jgi:hypothetical protein